MSKDCKSKEANAFEASTEGLAETGCIDVASIDLNALETGAVQVLEERPQDGKYGPQKSARKEDRPLLLEKAKLKRRALCRSPGKRTSSSLQS